MNDLNVDAAPSTSRFIEANGVKLHYLDYGTARCPPLVCVHGGAAHAHWFDFVAPGLTPDHHVFAPDLRGHGDSAWADPQTYLFETHAEDLHALLEKLDLNDVVLIGHSMGGMISLLHTATHPGRIGRLVIVDSIMLMPMDRVTKMREFSARPGKSYGTQDELVARYRLEPAESQLAAPEVIHRMAVHSGRKDGEGRWQHKADRRVYANFQQIAGVPLWEKIKVPALVITGERSTRFTPEVMANIQARAPQVQMKKVPASDHHIMLENPQGFVDVVQEFSTR